MPVYEYLCPSCNRIYSFLTPSANSDRQPVCPRCQATNLEKQVSRFAFVRGGARGRSKPVVDEGDVSPGGVPDMGDPRMEREMMRLMGEAEHMDENDPRQLGRLMRRMTELAGDPLDAEMEEAVRRLEAGEDPDKIEEDLGDLLGGGGEDEGYGPRGGPSYDDGLYPL